jgi:hypothetical protein
MLIASIYAGEVKFYSLPRGESTKKSRAPQGPAFCTFSTLQLLAATSEST